MTTPHQRRGYRRRWRVKNPEYSQRWYQKNKDSVIARVRAWKRLNSKKVKWFQRRWEKLNPIKRAMAQREWKKRNPGKVREAAQRRRDNPHQRIREALSSRINQAINKRSCGIKTIDALGCSLHDFLLYLESRFKVGMTWENYGKVWHVDHIMPCAVFDLTNPEHRRTCFHFSNLQPMFASENLRKGSKITTNQFNLL